jgi:hypothetical protein
MPKVLDDKYPSALSLSKERIFQGSSTRPIAYLEAQVSTATEDTDPAAWPQKVTICTAAKTCQRIVQPAPHGAYCPNCRKYITHEQTAVVEVQRVLT